MVTTLEGTKELWAQMAEMERYTREIALKQASKRRDPQLSEDIIRAMASIISRVAYEKILKNRIENLQAETSYDGWKKLYYEGSKAQFFSPLGFRLELEKILKGKDIFDLKST
jgi:hypothetical protein